jgi:hypothetical protein
MRLLSRAFWAAALPRAERSAAQGALVGAGFGQWHGEFDVISWHSLGAAATGAASMAILTILTALAAAPPEENPGG